MPNKVYNNVVDQRLLDNANVCEDVTSVTLPDLNHPTDTISAAGMVADVDVPNNYHLDAMEFAVAHNNGVNCRYLANPGVHLLETRIARQRYNVAIGEVELESVKVRVRGLHKGTTKGSVEAGNPLGSTEKYSVLRYEEEIGGEVVVLIDAAAGIMRYNGQDYASEVENLLK